MVKLQCVRIVEEEWEPSADFPYFSTEKAEAFAKIEIVSTEIDPNLQRADVYFIFKADRDSTAYADICTHESVWSCDFDMDEFDEEDEDKGIPSVWERFGVDEEVLGGALLTFGEHVLGMYS